MTNLLFKKLLWTISQTQKHSHDLKHITEMHKAEKGFERIAKDLLINPLENTHLQI